MKAPAVLARRVVAWLGVAAGVALLVFIAPHRNPWDMTRVHTSPGSGGVGLQWLGTRVELPLGVVLGGVAVTLLVMLGAAILRIPELRQMFARPVRLVLLALAIALLLLTLTPSGRAPEVVLNLALGSLGIALLVTGLTGAWPALLLRAERVRRSAAASLEAFPARALLGGLAAAVLFVTILGSTYLFGRIPHIVDSVDQVFHAKMFLLGRTWVAAPEPADFFTMTHMILTDRWYSQYPPGHTLLLAVGLLVRAPWLVNPLCGSLSVLVLYFIAREMYGEMLGRFAALLAAISPFLLLMSCSFMSHATTLLSLSLFLLGFARMVGRERFRDAALAGLGAGIAVSIRPLTAVAVAAPFAVYAVARAVRLVGRRGRAPRFALLSLAALATFAVPVCGLLAFNDATNGDPLLFGYEVLYGKDASLGFGRSGWWDTPHTPLRGLRATLRNFAALNQYLFGLPLPSLAFALLGLAWIRWKIWDLLLLSSVGSLALAYFFYWYQDWAIGPRFLYAATAPLVLLTARSLTALMSRLGESQRPAAGALSLALALSFSYGATVNVPVLVRFYERNHADGNKHVLRAVREQQSDRSVILVPGFYFTTFFSRNAPALDSDVIYALDRGPERNRELQARFPDRRFFKVVSLEDYTVVPYAAAGYPAEPAYPVPPGRPLTIEALTFQIAHLQNGYAGDQKTGEYGGGWKNHDQLRVSSQEVGAEVGFLLDAAQAETRRLSVVLTRAPRNGIVAVWLNDLPIEPGVDLYADEPDTVELRLGDVPLRRGRNGLLFRVVGKNDRATDYGMGLDYLTLE